MTRPLAALLVTVALAGCGARPRPELTGGFNPVWSPDGKQIAYINGNRLMVMRSPDGRGRHAVRVRIPNWEPGSFWELDWTAPSRIVFSGNSQLGIIDPATGRGRLLSGQVGSFSVSTDGRKVIYDHCYGGDHECSDSLAVVAATGGPSRLLPKPATASDGRPDVSPDGERVMFSRAHYDKQMGDTSGPLSLLVEPIAGGAARALDFSGYLPSWSPDGRWIAGCGITPNCAELVVARAAGGPTRLLLTRRVVSFSWSPDSKRLVCTTPDGVIGTVDLNAHFNAFPVEGFRLESLEGAGVGPNAWSPDGTQIVFMGRTRDHGSLTSGIYIISADGKGMHRLA